MQVNPSLDGSYDLLTLGETLLRLSPPGQQRLDQARLFEIGVGGSELNVGCLRWRGWGAGSPGCRGCLPGRSAASSTARRGGMASIPAGYGGSKTPAWG